jgi:serine protease Do
MSEAVMGSGSATRQRYEARSFAAVILLVAVSLAVGTLVRIGVQGAVERVDQGGLDVELPSGWIVLPPAGDRLLTAYDRLDPDVRYGVSVVAGTAGASPTAEDAAARRTQDRGQLLEGFAIVAEGPGSLGDVPTYEVRYTFVDRQPGGSSTPIEAIEHYFPDGAILPEDVILAVAVEAPPDQLEDALPGFERFALQLAGRSGATAMAWTAPRADVDRRLASIAGPSAGFGTAPTATADLVNATVQIFMVATIGGQEQPYGWGSGTILSKDGLILTNAHVAMPTAPGLGVFEADPTPAVDPEDLIVAVITAEDAPATPMYRASVINADGYLDAAVIRIDRDLDGQPISRASLNLPTAPIGNSDALRVGDPLTVIGFPGIGGNTISLSSGRVSGFLGDDRIGPRAWIKTDAVISGGNSGGLAANEPGELVGIPTRAREDVGGYSWVRPIALVMPMIEAAGAGRGSVDSAYLVPSTNREALRLDSWTTSKSACPARPRVTGYPSGSRNIIASLQHSGFATGEDLISQWRLDGEVVARTGIRFGSGAEQGGCYFGELYHDRGLPDGTYLLELYAGPNLRAMTTAQTTIGAAGATDSATLAGVVVDADSGRPLAGAVVFILAPGTDPGAWHNDPQESQIVSFAKTGSDGRFLVSGLTAGETYPALAVAEGYVSAGGRIGPMQAGANLLSDPIRLTRGAP